jgi:hypothetical protein
LNQKDKNTIPPDLPSNRDEAVTRWWFLAYPKHTQAARITKLEEGILLYWRDQNPALRGFLEPKVGEGPCT